MHGQAQAQGQEAKRKRSGLDWEDMFRGAIQRDLEVGAKEWRMEVRKDSGMTGQELKKRGVRVLEAKGYIVKQACIRYIVRGSSCGDDVLEEWVGFEMDWEASGKRVKGT